MRLNCLIEPSPPIRSPGELARRSGPDEDIGGQVGQAEIGLPLGRKGGLVPCLVRADNSLRRRGQAALARRGILATRALIPL